MTTRTRTTVIAALSVLVVLALVVVGVLYFNRPTSPPPPVDSERLRQAITTENVMKHLDEFQRIADANNGNRQAGKAGHAASVDYVEAQLRAAGLETRRQSFTYERPDFTRASLERVSPNATYEAGRDFRPMAFSGSGSVTAAVTPVDLNLAGDRRTTSGCEASDFAGFPRGTIALVQRGTCPFGAKVDHAIAAGASAVVILNQGNSDERRGNFSGTLGDPTRAVPVVATTFDHGAEWSATPTRLTVSVEGTTETVSTENLLADTPGAADRTVLVGAHLDGVAQGPGINDNGSGAAAILETARQFGTLGVRPANRVRFAFWSGEEDGLFGSRHYVDQLDDAGRRGTALYLNVDMAGSPNPVPYVYGGGDAGSGWPDGSGTVQTVLTDFLDAQGEAPETVTFRNSDHAPFLDAGVPVGGVFSGADETKSPRQAQTYGGTPDAAMDPCYHEACDRVDSIDDDMLGLMADAVAHATLTFAQSTEPVGRPR